MLRVFTSKHSYQHWLWLLEEDICPCSLLISHISSQLLPYGAKHPHMILM